MLLECHTEWGAVEFIHHVPVSHQSSEGWMFIIGFSVLFLISLFDSVCLLFFLPTLNCTRQDILLEVLE